MGWAASSTVKIPGRTEQIPWIRFEQMSSPDTARQFAVILSPFRSVEEAPPEGRRVSDRHFIVSSPGDTSHLYFSRGRYADGTLDTDAEFVLVRFAAGSLPSYALIEGSYIRYRGKPVFSAREPGSYEGEIHP
jgi:hypothetical protein